MEEGLEPSLISSKLICPALDDSTILVILSGFEPETLDPESKMIHFTTGQYKHKKPSQFRLTGFYYRLLLDNTLPANLSDGLLLLLLSSCV